MVDVRRAHECRFFCRYCGQLCSLALGDDAMLLHNVPPCDAFLDASAEQFLDAHFPAPDPEAN